MTAETGRRSIEVWDAPTRIFHWSLVVAITIAWFTGEGEGLVAQLHAIAGAFVAGLIVFRLIWGFAGGEHARFGDFLVGPELIVAHVRDLLGPSPKRYLGHNPLGGSAVILLLAIVSGVVITGLFSSSDDLRGPFATANVDLSDAHEVLFRALQALVVVHVLGVAAESWKARDNLVAAMITGRKRLAAHEAGVDARSGQTVALAAALVTGAVVFIALALATSP
jgi:cytochrome b